MCVFCGVLHIIITSFLQHNASQEDFLRRNITPAVKNATFDLASLAHTHLLKVSNVIVKGAILCCALIGG